ncbi:hypothetical protein V2G26_001985 [Clonostachys chloroleuca]
MTTISSPTLSTTPRSRLPTTSGQVKEISKNVAAGEQLDYYRALEAIAKFPHHKSDHSAKAKATVPQIRTSKEKTSFKNFLTARKKGSIACCNSYWTAVCNISPYPRWKRLGMERTSLSLRRDAFRSRSTTGHD